MVRRQNHSSMLVTQWPHVGRNAQMIDGPYQSARTPLNDLDALQGALNLL